MADTAAAAAVPTPPVHTTHDGAVILCGICDAVCAGVTGTDAEQIATITFGDDFKVCMDYNEEELKSNLKTFCELRANQGKITLLPIQKKHILAFVLQGELKFSSRQGHHLHTK